MEEKQFLDSLVNEYPSCDKSPHTRLIRDLLIRTFSPHFQGVTALELGCETGYMTSLLSSHFQNVEVIDGSQEFIDIASSRKFAGNVTFHNKLFEDLLYHCFSYRNVFACHVLEHVLLPDFFLQSIKNVLQPNGKLFIAVPNARNAGRQLALSMGLITSLYKLTPNDIKGGHRRVYDQQTLVAEVEKAGLKVVESGGVYFKPFADFQMDKIMECGVVGEQQIEGLYKMGKLYPELCADSYVVAIK